MDKMTITEALAELKTLQKRIEKKRESIGPYLLRQSIVLDPLIEQGGSKEFIKRERQALGDLENRVIAIRTTIQKTNQVTPITISGKTATIAEWLTWRKEVAPGAQRFLNLLRGTINKNRDEFLKKGGQVAEEVKPDFANLIINIDELALIKEIEMVETVLGQLDGMLSLLNATTMIEF